MVAFLRAKRREGKAIAWIAERLGLAKARVVGKAARLRLIVRRPREPSVFRADEPAPLGALCELAEAGLCRWIAAHTDEPWRMCARVAVNGTPWCPHHLARAYARARG
jgi:hypothetical protein